MSPFQKYMKPGSLWTDSEVRSAVERLSKEKAKDLELIAADKIRMALPGAKEGEVLARAEDLTRFFLEIELIQRITAGNPPGAIASYRPNPNTTHNRATSVALGCFWAHICSKFRDLPIPCCVVPGKYWSKTDIDETTTWICTERWKQLVNIAAKSLPPHLSEEDQDIAVEALLPTIVYTVAKYDPGLSCVNKENSNPREWFLAFFFRRFEWQCRQRASGLIQRELRRQDKYPRVELPSEEGLASRGKSPEEAFLEKERKRRARTLLSKLENHQLREALRQRFFKERTVKDTAKRMRVSEQTIKNWTRRGLQNIRKESL